MQSFAIADLLPLFLREFLGNVLMYALFVAPLFVLFWVLWKRRFQHLRIQEKVRATIHHFKHDLGHTVVTLAIFAIMDLTLVYLESCGYTLLYYDVGRYGWAYWAVSLALVLFLHDTFFYWTHRAMHHPRLYRFFHRVHHESTDPSPLTSGAFHPSEAIVENALQFILPFVMPLHFGVILVWQLFDLSNNVLAHLGYELYPKGWVKLPILRYKTASVHHNMHHQLFHGNYALYFTWWDKWMGTEFPDYEQRHEQIFERKHIQKTADGLYTLALSDRRWETSDAFTLTFSRVPVAFRNFSAGQHITLRVVLDGTTHYRTFSISSTPNTSDAMSLTIKRIPGGLVTNYLADRLSVGDQIDLCAPAGTFCIDPDPARKQHYVFIAGGSGITPIYSMICILLSSEPKSRLTLLYANRTSASTIFKDALENLARKHADRFIIKNFLSEEAAPAQGTQGFITRVSLEEVLNQDPRQSPSFYLCGPAGMTDKLISDLSYLGVDASRIHREVFAMQAPKADEAATSTGAQVHAIVYGAEHRFETVPGKTILQSALVQEVMLPFSCQGGVCGTCRMKCTNGEVRMAHHPALNMEDVRAGYILTCQAYAVSEEITIQNA